LIRPDSLPEQDIDEKNFILKKRCALFDAFRVLSVKSQIDHGFIAKKLIEKDHLLQERVSDDIRLIEKLAKTLKKNKNPNGKRLLNHLEKIKKKRLTELQALNRKVPIYELVARSYGYYLDLRLKLMPETIDEIFSDNSKATTAPANDPSIVTTPEPAPIENQPPAPTENQPPATTENQPAIAINLIDTSVSSTPVEKGAKDIEKESLTEASTSKGKTTPVEPVEIFEIPTDSQYVSAWGKNIEILESKKIDLEMQLLEKIEELPRVQITKQRVEEAIMAWIEHSKTSSSLKPFGVAFERSFSIEKWSDFYDVISQKMEHFSLPDAFKKEEIILASRIELLVRELRKEREIKDFDMDLELYIVNQKIERLTHLIHPDMPSNRVLVVSKKIYAYKITELPEEKEATKHFSKLDWSEMMDQLKYGHQKFETEYKRLSEMTPYLKKLKYLAASLPPFSELGRRISDTSAEEKNKFMTAYSINRGYQRIHAVFLEIFDAHLAKQGIRISGEKPPFLKTCLEQFTEPFGKGFNVYTEGTTAVGPITLFSLGDTVSDSAFDIMLATLKSARPDPVDHGLDILKQFYDYNRMPAVQMNEAAAIAFKYAKPGIQPHIVLAKRGTISEVTQKSAFLNYVLISAASVVEIQSAPILKSLLSRSVVN
jgi:hypothetical protein